MSEVNSLSRQQLYDLVWRAPVDKLAKELGITGPELGKLCRQHSIPVPPRGYWARVAVGRASAPPPLTGMDRPPKTDIALPAIRAPKLPKSQSAKAPQPETFENLWLEHSKLVGNIHVPQKLRRPHRLIARWLGAEHPRHGDFQKNRWSPSSRSDKQHPTPLEFRRLRILNALFRRLEANGLSLRVSTPQTDFVVHSDYGEVTFRLAEWIREYRQPLTPNESNGSGYKYRKSQQIQEATGLLEFRITSLQPEGVPDRWQELDNTIEELLPQIIAAISLPFEIARWRREKREAQRKKRLEIQAQDRERTVEDRGRRSP